MTNASQEAPTTGLPMYWELWLDDGEHVYGLLGTWTFVFGGCELQVVHCPLWQPWCSGASQGCKYVNLEFPYKCDKLFPPLFFFFWKNINKSCHLTSAWPQSVSAGKVGDKPAVTCIFLLDLVGPQLLCVHVLQQKADKQATDGAFASWMSVLLLICRINVI